MDINLANQITPFQGYIIIYSPLTILPRLYIYINIHIGILVTFSPVKSHSIIETMNFLIGRYMHVYINILLNLVYLQNILSGGCSLTYC